MTVENCGNCAFWVLTDDTGQCRARSPVVSKWADSRGVVHLDNWPHTYPNDFCGEFELKDAS